MERDPSPEDIAQLMLAICDQDEHQARDVIESMIAHIRRECYSAGLAAARGYGRSGNIAVKLPSRRLPVTNLPFDFSLRNRSELDKVIAGRPHIWVTANRINIENEAGLRVLELQGTGPDFPWLQVKERSYQSRKCPCCESYQIERSGHQHNGLWSGQVVVKVVGEEDEVLGIETYAQGKLLEYKALNCIAAHPFGM